MCFFTPAISLDSISVILPILAKDQIFGQRALPLTGKGSVIAKVVLSLNLG